MAEKEAIHKHVQQPYIQLEKDPEFFAKLAHGQSPQYLWIGCSDSRIPADQVTGLQAGDAFVHRNIANLVCSVDLSVMGAAMNPQDLGLLNPWLRNIRDIYRLYKAELEAISDRTARYDRLVELNVIEQCRNIAKTAAVQQSYAAHQFPVVSGWEFRLQDGLLKDLNIECDVMLKYIQNIYDLAS
ncbi:carbonic anhydrase [Xylogone sp. PMI_703]|nr:carbonic anhydrase [Xylogone sp. PMI_703]